MRVSSTLSLGVGSWSRNAAQTRQLSGQSTFPFMHTHGFKSMFASYFQGKNTWQSALVFSKSGLTKRSQLWSANSTSLRSSMRVQLGENRTEQILWRKPPLAATPGCPSCGGGVQTSAWRTAPGDWALLCWFIVYSSKFRTNTPTERSQARRSISFLEGGQSGRWIPTCKKKKILGSKRKGLLKENHVCLAMYLTGFKWKTWRPM